MSVITAIIIVSVIGLLAGVGLCIASFFMEVPTDERVEKIREVLPGANCGGCGYSGCDAYAAALADGSAKPGACAPGGNEVTAKIAEILGVEATSDEKKAAFVACNGTCDNTERAFEYNGISTCAAANMYYSGDGNCKYGCLGYGDCTRTCRFSAISVVNGKAVTNTEKCTGCGACVSVCPKRIISLLPVKRGAYISCSNKDKALAAKPVCKVSCIGCGLCARKCPSGAIEIKNNLPQIDYSKCTGCGECKAACPRKAIV